MRCSLCLGFVVVPYIRSTVHDICRVVMKGRETGKVIDAAIELARRSTLQINNNERCPLVSLTLIFHTTKTTTTNVNNKFSLLLPEGDYAMTDFGGPRLLPQSR